MILLLLFLTQIQKPLPDRDSFLNATKAELIAQLDEHQVLKTYTYHRKTTHESLDSEGNIKDSEITEEEIVQDAGHRHHGPIFDSNSKTDNGEIVEDMFRIWTMIPLRRDTLNGRPAIVIAFAPKKKVHPQTEAGRWIFRNVKGVVWVDEADHHIVRMHASLTNDVSIAWGLLAKAHKGSEYFREWQKVNDDVWLPSRSQLRVRARALVVGFRFEEIEEYSNYRKTYAETKPASLSPR